ncbi:MAG TPA: D-alanyl-D-alanine carboxypeptidase family protein [Bacillota bacterium]|nr:D-alanyl-D-alanine carboxypeptidase family protein [Bacillota bacterium]
MRIWVVSRQTAQIILWSAIGLMVLGSIFSGYFFQQQMTAGHLVRQQYPPLVYFSADRKGPALCAGAAVLIEVTSGAVLYMKNAEQRRAPASTTKIMTAIVALEKGNLNQVVKVSRRAAITGGSTIWLKKGQRLVLKELLEGMMLRSGNDGSIAVAEGVAGSTAAFVKLMNLKAKELGALNTNFRNPHGLRAPSHYTTALDLAIITRYALGNHRFAKLVRTKTACLEWVEGAKQVEIRNTNRLLWALQGVDGVKTGTTNEAGHCLVASATRDGKKFVAVVLNSCNRWNDCTKLLEYGFENFSIVKLAASNHPVKRIPVIGSKTVSISLYPRNDLTAVVEKGTENMLKTEIRIFKSPVKAPLVPGQALGKISYRYQGQFVEGVDLINLAPVKRRWFWW